MWRVDSATAVVSRPAPGAAGTQGWFGPGTIVDQDIMNCMMGELDNAVFAAGLTPSKTDLTQLSQVFELYLPLAGGSLTGPLGVGAPTPVKPLHVAGVASGEIFIEATDGLANFRGWNFLIGGAAGAKQGFALRFMTDDGLTTHFTALAVEPNAGLVTMLVVTPPPLDNSNSPVDTAYLTAASAMIDYPGGTTLQLTDQGRPLRFSTTGAGTWTIPAFGSVPYADGVAMVILVGSGSVLTLNEGTNTLTWLPSGAAGNRTITGPARVTLTHYTTNEWYLDGTGIS